MKIIIDAFGGDYCPEVPVKAAIEAVKEYEIEVILVGDEEKTKSLLDFYGCTDKRISIYHASQVITNNEQPAVAVREKKDSSIVVGAILLRSGEGDAFVSAGNTGGILAASVLNIGRIKGVRRPALAALLPSGEGKILLLDCGANTECKPEDLYAFAVMGSIYMENLEGVKNPKVALLSNGTENGKGDNLVKEAYNLIYGSNLNFVGNKEGRDISLGQVDVMVCGGFCGNIALKTMEGTAKMVGGSLKSELCKNFRTKLGAALLKKELVEFSQRFDYKQYGGAPFLGIKAPVIKAHGSSDVNSFIKAIEQACVWVRRDVNNQIEQALSKTTDSER